MSLGLLFEIFFLSRKWEATIQFTDKSAVANAMNGTHQVADIGGVRNLIYLPIYVVIGVAFCFCNIIDMAAKPVRMGEAPDRVAAAKAPMATGGVMKDSIPK